jgi:hypothetical protein
MHQENFALLLYVQKAIFVHMSVKVEFSNKAILFPYFTSTVKENSTIYIGHIVAFRHSARPKKSKLVIPALWATKRQTQTLSGVKAYPAGCSC